jgi:ABC-type multidrug transport system ATPase subunit
MRKEEKMFVIDLKEISKNYGTKKVLNSINLTINENDCIGILGANGSGKTTLVEIICQIKTPSSGEIKSNFSNQIKDYIGAQFQDSGS